MKYVMKPMLTVMGALTGNLEAKGVARFIKAFQSEEGSTAVHRAAARGDVGMLKLFKEVRGLLCPSLCPSLCPLITFAALLGPSLTFAGLH